MAGKKIASVELLTDERALVKGLISLRKVRHGRISKDHAASARWRGVPGAGERLSSKERRVRTMKTLACYLFCRSGR